MFPLKVSAHVDFPKTRTTKNSWFGVVHHKFEANFLTLLLGRSSTYSILHTPINDWFVYAHDYALPGFRADARLHQRRHDRQEVRVDILHVTSVPILTSNS